MQLRTKRVLSKILIGSMMIGAISVADYNPVHATQPIYDQSQSEQSDDVWQSNDRECADTCTEEGLQDIYDMDTLTAVRQIVTFGRFEQDYNSLNGAEPIRWIVLADNGYRRLLLSEKILYAYDSHPNNFGDLPEYTTWETSWTRQWLNNTFYQTAFNGTEKGNIMVCSLNNPGIDAELYGTRVRINGGNATKDKVFILSSDEIKAYLPNRTDRIARKTKQVAASWVWDADCDDCDDGYHERIVMESNERYLLRSPAHRGYPEVDGAVVGDNGTIDEAAGPAQITKYGIRPAIWVYYKNPGEFTDISANAWYRDAVAYVAFCGYMSGKGNGKFAPNQSITRAEFATILYNKEGRPGCAYSNRFSDVKNGKWFTQPVLWVVSKGIAKGYAGSNKFGVSDPISREQMAQMLYSYAKWKGYNVNASASLSRFKDGSKVSSWAQTAMKWVVANGIINGSNDSVPKLNPQGNATRAECASMIMKFVEKFN